MFEKLLFWHGRLLLLFAWVSGIALLAVSLTTTVDVMVRWSTGRPLLGILEISEVAFVLVTFFAVGLMLFRNSQLSVDIITTQLGRRSKDAVKIIDCVCGTVFFGLILSSSVIEFSRAYQGGYARNGILQIPETFPLAFVAIGTFLACVTLLLQGRAAGRHAILNSRKSSEGEY
jgi:TRAP-type C4-dicarboxylate transport system permease small subunit